MNVNTCGYCGGSRAVYVCGECGCMGVPGTACDNCGHPSIHRDECPDCEES